MTMVSALELGILIQLIQEDKKLNHSLRNLCSSFFYTDGDTRANGYLDQDGMGQTSAEVLKNASVLYNEISIWATSRKMHSPMNTRECPSVGEQLIRKCRRLGFLGTRSSEALESSPDADLAEARRPIKVFCDGVFDLVHAGHFNALRQAAQLGDELYVGVCSDDEVLKAKGALPLYTVEERAEIVRACKWVTDVIIGTPYDIDMEFF